MGILRLLAAAVAVLAAGPSWAGSIVVSSGATLGFPPAGPTYDCSGVGDCTLNVTDLLAILASADVTLTARGADADIIVADTIEWTSSKQLALVAANDVILQANIAASGGGKLTMRADARCIGDGGIVPGTATISADTVAYTHDDVSLATTVVSGSLAVWKLIDTTTELAALPATGAFALGCDMTDPGGYIPVATFGGSFDGLGHAVIDLLVPEGHGLFVELNGATVSNLVLVRPAVSSVVDDVGALAGKASSSAIADVAVLGGVVSGASGVGGLVGTAVATTLTRIYASGSVTGGNHVGGVVGSADGAGIAGTASVVSNVMSKVRVSGTSRAGGIAGSIGANNPLAGASIATSWSAGEVMGTNEVGGALGAVGLLGSTSNVYWDTQASGVPTSAGGTGRTTAQMRQQATFSGFDFTSVWAIRPSISRPFLRSLQSLLDATVAVNGSGSTIITQAASFTATVTPSAPYELPATGSVRFLDGATALDTATLVSGAATVSSTTLGLGSHTIRAIYAGDAYHLESDGSVAHIVNAGATQTALAAQGGPIVATVSAVAPATGTPTGSITFNVDGVNRAPVTLVGPTATLDPSTTGAGLHTIIATFASDDGRFGPSTSPSIQVTVVGPTSTALAQSSAATALGEAFELVATVTSGEGTPTGTVRFVADGAVELAEVALTNGTASTAVTTLSAGRHIIVAQYLPASTDFTASVSEQLAHDVAKADATTNLTVADVHDGVLTLNVEVLGPAPGLPIPTGEVVFTIDGLDVGDPALVEGVATFTSEQLTRGTHVVTARYAGDVNYNGSAGPQIEVLVELEGFRLAVTPRRAATFAGGSVPFTLTLTPEAETFAERVTFSCADLPPGGSCAFSPALTDVASVGTQSGLLVNTQRPILASGRADRVVPPGVWPILLLAAGAMVLWRLTRRARIAAIAVAAVVACTDSPSTVEPRDGTPVGTYVVTVIAQGETIRRTTTVEVEVR